MNRNLFNSMKEYANDQRKNLAPLILCILLFIFSIAVIAKDTEQKKQIELGILDFLYVTEAGYDPQYSFEKNIEKGGISEFD